MSTTTRKQMFLEKINDSSFSAPVPITVEEEILDGISGGSGGSSNVMVVTITQDGATFSANKTILELKEAISNGTPIIADLQLDGADEAWILCSSAYYSADFGGLVSLSGSKFTPYNDIEVIFYNITIDNSSVNCNVLRGSISYTSAT